MEIFLIVALFASTALSLNFIVGEKYKLSGMFDIINLCLIVALAYQFKLMDTILLILVAIAIILIGGFIFIRKRKKDKENELVEAKIIENKE